MKYYIPLLFISLLFILGSCKNEDPEPSDETQTQTGDFAIHFMPHVGEDSLQYVTKQYLTEEGDTFTVSDFKFYVSNIQLTASGDTEAYKVPDSYHLIGGFSGNSASVVLEDVPVGAYDTLKLAIGIDSAANYSTDHTGDLDPNNDMAWNWNTGYKFVLLEGTYTSDTASGGLVYHIGTDANYTPLVYALSGLSVKANQNGLPAITIHVDIAEFFKNPNTIDIDNGYNEIQMGGKAAEIAENWRNGVFDTYSIQTEN